MNTFLLHRTYQKIKYNKVTQWFHTCIEEKEHEGTPAETIMEMNDLFINLIKTKRLNLGVSEKIFRRSICNALCTMKYYDNTQIYRTNVIIKNNYPAEWNMEIESMWQEWLETHCFLNWTAFWARVPVREWEDALPGWRKAMEYLLPTYIQRNIDSLVDAHLIVEDEQGEYVDSNQYDYGEERWGE